MIGGIAVRKVSRAPYRRKYTVQNQSCTQYMLLFDLMFAVFIINIFFRNLSKYLGIFHVEIQ